MQNKRADFVFLVGVAGLVFFCNLGGPKLWDRDEPRNAGCAREMMTRGDWVVPVFNAELRTHKPVLLYWLIMSAYAIFGVSEFSARLWSATLGVGTVLLTYQIGTHLFDRHVGRVAGCVLATFLLFVVVARAATPDAALIFSCTLAMWLFVRSSFVPADGGARLSPNGSWRTPFPASQGTAVGIYAAMGMAVLAKGPVGLILPTAVIGMFCLLARLPVQEAGTCSHPQHSWWHWLRRLSSPFWPRHFFQTCWAMRPLTALVIVLSIAGPWYAWVGIRTHGEWLMGFFGEHNFGRATAAMEGHGGWVLFYPIAIVLGCLPWSVFAVPVAMEMVRRIQAGRAHRQPYVFLACWLVVYVALFSLASTKLPSYVAPAYPAVAIMISAYVLAVARGHALAPQVWWRAGFATLALVGVFACGGLAYATWRYVPELRFAAAIGTVLCAAGVAGWHLACRAEHQLATGVAVIGSVCFAVLSFGLLSVKVSDHQHCEQLVTAAREGDAAAPLAAFGRLEPSWVFYARRPVRFFHDDSQLELVRYLRSENQPMLITTRRRLQSLPKELTGNLALVTSVPYFLKDEQLLLLSPRATDAIAARARRSQR